MAASCYTAQRSHKKKWTRQIRNMFWPEPKTQWTTNDAHNWFRNHSLWPNGVSVIVGNVRNSKAFPTKQTCWVFRIYRTGFCLVPVVASPSMHDAIERRRRRGRGASFAGPRLAARRGGVTNIEIVRILIQFRVSGWGPSTARLQTYVLMLTHMDQK